MVMGELLFIYRSVQHSLLGRRCHWNNGERKHPTGKPIHQFHPRALESLSTARENGQEDARFAWCMVEPLSKLVRENSLVTYYSTTLFSHSCEAASASQRKWCHGHAALLTLAVVSNRNHTVNPGIRRTFTLGAFRRLDLLPLPASLATCSAGRAFPMRLRLN